MLVAAMSRVTDTQHWLQFISTTIWQVIVISLLILYRDQIRDLISNITKFKILGVEGEIQKSMGPGVEISKDALNQLEILGADGFLSLGGIKHLVETSGLLAPGDKVEECCNIFRTQRQRTWLVSTASRLLCVLDDEAHRNTGTVIRWILEKNEAHPIEAIQSKGRVGTLSIGPRRGWLYSTSLFSTAEKLEEHVKKMVRAQP
jgi:hypothetical protein